MFCKKCHKEIPEGSAFCLYCGARQEPKRNNHRRANGMGTVYYYGSSWRAEWTRGWKAVQSRDGTQKMQRVAGRKSGFKHKADAEAFLRKCLSGVKHPSKRTLSDMYAFFSEHEMKKKASSTQYAYKKAWGRCQSIAFTPIDLLELTDLQPLIAGYSFDLAKDIRDLLSKLYQLAIAQKITTVNLSKFIVLPDADPKEQLEINQEELSSIWDAYSSGYIFAGYILLLSYTGMMPGELMKCTKDMIDWEHHEINFCGLKTQIRKKRPIVFPDFMEPVLRSLCDYSKSKTGKLLDMGKQRFYKEFWLLKKRCSLREGITPYSSRRTVGTELGRLGIAPAVITDAMRHSDYETTLKYYTKLDTTDVREALGKIPHPKEEQRS